MKSRPTSKNSTLLQLSVMLVKSARSTAEKSKRTVEGQVEYWARLGRVLDAAISDESRAKIAKGGGSIKLTTAIAQSQSPSGRKKAKRAISKGKRSA